MRDCYRLFGRYAVRCCEAPEGCDIVPFKNENWQHTAFADDTFDTIFSGFALSCVDDKANAMQESYRILKP